MAISDIRILNVEVTPTKNINIQYGGKQLNRLAMALKEYNVGVYGKFSIEEIEADLRADLYTRVAEHHDRLRKPGDYLSIGTAGYVMNVHVYAKDEPADKSCVYVADLLIDPEILFLNVERLSN